MEADDTRRPKGVPLKDVVADCVRRWFEECLKAAEAGDPEMQSLVGQMFYSGYGVRKDHNKGLDWLKLAAERHQDAARLLVFLSGQTNDNVHDSD